MFSQRFKAGFLASVFIEEINKYRSAIYFKQKACGNILKMKTAVYSKMSVLICLNTRRHNPEACEIQGRILSIGIS
jgi:hypothetical protein